MYNHPISRSPTHQGSRYPTHQGNKIYAIQLRIDNPDMTLLAIGNIVGITKERVRQILKKAGMETRSTKEAYNRQPPHLKFSKQPCPTCNKPVPYRQINSKTYNSYHPKYHIECRPSQLFMDLVCPYCDKSFQLGMYYYNRKLKCLQNGSQKAIYCSRQCVSDAYWDSVHQRIPNDYGYVMRGEANTSARTTFQCGTCGVEKSIRCHEYNFRIKNSTTGLLFCSRICLGRSLRVGAI